MVDGLQHLLEVLIALVFGSYGYTYVCSLKTVKRDEFKNLQEKIDKIYDILVKKGLDANGEKKEQK